MSNKKEPPKPQAQVPQPVPSKPGDPPAPNPEKKEEKKRGSQPSKAQAQIPQPVPPKPVDPPPEPEKKEEKKDEKKRGSYPLANEKMWFLKEPVDNRGRKNRIYFKDMEKSECAVICVGVAPKIVKLVDVIKENMTTRDVRINEIVPESLEIDDSELVKTREEMTIREKFRELEREKLTAEMYLLKQRIVFLESVVEEQGKLLKTAKQVEEGIGNAQTFYNTKLKDLKNNEKKSSEALHDFKNKFAHKLKL